MRITICQDRVVANGTLRPRESVFGGLLAQGDVTTPIGGWPIGRRQRPNRSSWPARCMPPRFGLAQVGGCPQSRLSPQSFGRVLMLIRSWRFSPDPWSHGFRVGGIAALAWWSGLKSAPMQRQLGSQVVLLLQNVIDRGLAHQEGMSSRPVLRSSSRHVLTLRALRGAGGLDTQNQRRRGQCRPH